MKLLKNYSFLFVLAISSFFTSCSSSNDENPDDQKVTSLFFSVEDDLALGRQVMEEIEGDPANIVLDSASNVAAYAYLYGMVDKILESGKVQYKDEFVWRLRIIHDDENLNAFCAPGGYIYVYTGLINYLDSADHLAGVMGHEIAHADRRHVSKNMEKQYGLSVMISVLAGDNPGMLAEMAQGLIGLKFSRAHEEDADEFSVVYLCETEYKSDRAAGFFQKLIDEGSAGGTPEFLSTHPNPDNRVESIHQHAWIEDVV